MHHYTIFLYIYMFIFYHILLFLSSHSNFIIATSHHIIIIINIIIINCDTQNTIIMYNNTIKWSPSTSKIVNIIRNSRHAHDSHIAQTHTLYPTHTHTRNKPYIIASSIRCSCNLCIILFINHFEYFFSFLVLFPVCEPFLKI